MGSFSIWHWLVVLVIIILVFGTKKLGAMGKDVGAAVRGFKEGINEGGEITQLPPREINPSPETTTSSASIQNRDHC